MMISRLLTLIATACAFSAATLHAESPERGVWSKIPGKRWEDSFVTGSGRMGAMLFGGPESETFVANHCRLFLPLGSPEIVPDLAKHLPELRELIRTKDYGAAMQLFLGKAKEQGFPGMTWTDKFHPGVIFRIKQPTAGKVRDFERTENFATGEVVERWKDDRGEFRRRAFVSRTENVIALHITGPAPCELEFPPLEHELIEVQQTTTDEWVNGHHIYRKGKGGFDTAVRIVRREEGRDTLVLIRIAPWKTPVPKDQSDAWECSPDHPDFKTPGIYKPAPPLADSSVVAYRSEAESRTLLPQLKAALAAVSTDYEALLAPHAKAHGELFQRVTLDLGGSEDRARTSEELLDLAKRENRMRPALMEKMYDAGRYMFICSAGESAPNLQGIWTGSWTANWSGDYTLNSNVQAAIAAGCSANLGDLMGGYFRLMESFYPDWRLNAQRIYGCRGFFTNSRASNNALQLHWGGFKGVFWTAGCGWLASFFTDYAEYSGDREFLAKRCVPLLKEVVAFYEDFLTETDAEGHVAFIPSYNPESSSGVNATMDIAVAREMLTKLIAACRELKIESESVPKWEALLAKLAPYPVDRNGEIPEYPGGRVQPKHRHHSQLYPCFQSFDPLFESDGKLRAAAQATVRAKIAAADNGGEDSSFGRVQAGTSAAFLGMAEEAYSRLEIMATRRSMHPSFITAHNPGPRTFNTDGNGGIPQIANLMLLFSRADRIDLLPALPKAWPDGSIRGLRARGGFEVNVTWAKGKLTRAEVRSLNGGRTTVHYGTSKAELSMKRGETVTLDGDLKVTH